MTPLKCKSIHVILSAYGLMHGERFDQLSFDFNFESQIFDALFLMFIYLLMFQLEELGTLCGLMPGMNHDSECIHKVVNLISGMGNDPYSGKTK